MEQPKKELIKGIADLFEDYEESYVPGEWEAFLQDKKGKRKLFPVILRIAAILFLIISVLPLHVDDLFTNGLSDKVADQKPVLKKNNTLLPDQSILIKPLVTAAQRINRLSPSVSYQKKSLSRASGAASLASTDNFETTNSSSTFIKDTITSVLKHQQVEKSIVYTKGRSDTTVHEKNKKMSTIDFLMAESKSGTTAAKKKTDGPKWDFGVEVIPTATTVSMNVGAGLTTAYRISNKFSISSGISITQLEGGKNVNGTIVNNSVSNNQVAFARELSSKQVVAVAANIKAIDIPVGLIYHLNKHYYTSAGISYFNVISEKRDNTIVQVSQVNQASFDPQTGMTASYKTIISQEVAEPANDKPLKGNSYLGFFNFSIGRKQNIFGKYNVLIEPFVKVPLGELSNEDLKLLNSGIKFQLSF